MPVVTPGGYGRFTEPAPGVEDLKQANGGIFAGGFGAPTVNNGSALPSTEVKPTYREAVAFKKTPSVDASDVSGQRRENAGLNRGGANSRSTRLGDPSIQSGVSSTSIVATEDDWRIRVSLPSKSPIFYQNNKSGAGAMTPIIESGLNGVVFPYTPSIQVQHNARYQPQNLTHSNYTSYFYEGSDVSAITISGEFTAQNEDEGAYVMASIWFFRACTKMFFGQSSTLPVGTPPTIVFLDGYGQYYFPHVSCVVTNFSHTLPADADYIALRGRYQGTRIPTISTLAITLQPVVSRKRVHENFNLDEYAAGNLLGDKKGIGGFL